MLVTALAVGVVSAVQLAVSPRVGSAQAAVTTGSAGLFVPAQGTVLDTRSGAGGVSGPVAAYTWYPVQVAGLAGVPTSRVSSVQLSVTAFNPSLTGYIKAAVNGTADIQTSALLYTGGGGSFSASSIVALATDGKIRYQLIRLMVKWPDQNVVSRGPDGDYGTKLRMYDVRRDSSGRSRLANTSGTGW